MFGRELRRIQKMMAEEGVGCHIIAEVVGLSESTVYRMLHGITQEPRFRTVWVLCSYFGINIQLNKRQKKAA